MAQVLAVIALTLAQMGMFALGVTIHFSFWRPLIILFFGALQLALIVRVVTSWLVNMLPGVSVILWLRRVTTNLTDPFLDPIQKRLPPMSLGILNMNATIAIIFTWWFMGFVSSWLQSALPSGW